MPISEPLKASLAAAPELALPHDIQLAAKGGDASGEAAWDGVGGVEQDRDPTNEALIDAVEAGDLDAIADAIEKGANAATARKHVSISAMIVTGRVPTAQTDGNGGKDRGETTELPLDRNLLSRSTEAEPALALAIKGGDANVVTTLLGFKADPNAPLEWQLPKVEDWEELDREGWDAGRWSPGESYHSALAMALDTGLRYFNKRGGFVDLQSPPSLGDVVDSVTLTPSKDVISALLDGGAHVLTADLEAAEKLSLELRELLLETVKANPEQLIRAHSDARAEIANLKQQKAELEEQALFGGKATWGFMPFGRVLPTDSFGATELKKLLTCTSPHKPSQVDEITLEGSNKVFVWLRFGDGWGQGFNMSTGELGFFPMACLADITDEEARKRSLALPPHVHPRNSSARHLSTMPEPGSIFSSAPNATSPTLAPAFAESVSSATSSTAAASVAALPESVAAVPPVESAPPTPPSTGPPLKRTVQSALDAMKNGETRLDLNDIKLDSDDGGHIAGALKDNKTVRELYIHNNALGDEGAKALANALKTNRTLLSLWINRNGIGPEGAKALSEALRENNVLVELNLRENKIGDEGARSLADMLQGSTSIETLRLASCDIGPDGAKRLAEALKKNTSLKHLALYENKIGDEGTEAIAEALKSNQALNHLRLYDTGAGDGGAGAMADALKINRKLAYLNLMKNPNISPTAMLGIVSALEDSNNRTLKELYIKDNSNLAFG